MKNSPLLLIIIIISFFFSADIFAQSNIFFEYSVPAAQKLGIKSVKIFKQENDEKAKLFKILNYDFVNYEIEKIHGYFLTTECKMRYDSKGNHISGAFMFGNIITGTDSSAYHYDEDSLLLKYFYLSRNEDEVEAGLPAKLNYTEKYVYNSDKKVIEKTRWEKDSIISSKTVYKYNSSGIISGGEVYNGNSKLYEELFYDEKGNLVKTENKYVSPDYRAVKYYIFRYNSGNQRYYFAGYDTSDKLIFESEDHMNITGSFGETINTEWDISGKNKITRFRYEYEYER